MPELLAEIHARGGASADEVAADVLGAYEQPATRSIVLDTLV